MQAIEVLSIEPPASEPMPAIADLCSATPEEVALLPLLPARVKWFDKAKGFGFANVFAQKADVFLHIEVLRHSGFSDLAVGEAIALRVVDGRRGMMAATRLKAGTVAINDSYMGWAVMDAPMGGFKESGIGRRHGPDGIRKFTEPQTIVRNRTPWQIGSSETALALNRRTADLLAGLLKLWRRVPFMR